MTAGIRSENVDVEKVINVLLNNASKAKNMIKNIINTFENHVDSNILQIIV